MSYTKQNFQPNAVLTAAQLNAMDNQIYDNAEDIGELKEDLSQFESSVKNGDTIQKVISDSDWINNKRVSGYTTDSVGNRIPNISDLSAMRYVVIDLAEMTEISTNKQLSYTGASYTPLEITDSAGHWISDVGRNNLINKTFSATWFSYENDVYTIDVTALKDAIPNAAKIYFCHNYSNDTDVILTATIVTTGIDDIADELVEVENTLNSISLSLPKPVLDLPPIMTAVVGHEYNIYKHNIVWGADSDDYDVSISIPNLGGDYIQTKNYERFYRFKPVVSNIGTRNCTVRVYNKYTGKEVASGTFVLRVIADSTLSGKKVLFIGDSLTEAAIYPAEIQHNLSDGGIESLGTYTSTVTIGGERLSVHHEGRAGWSASDLCNYYETKSHTNAFWNPNTNKFDFTYYMNKQGYTELDAVCLNLGTNPDANLDTTISSLNEIIASIREFDSSVPIIISLINYGCDQNGWGTRGSSSAWPFARRVKATHDRYRDEYAGREDENISLSEVYVMLDEYYDFGLIEVDASERNPKQVTIQNNTEHPDGYGYLHFADCYYNNLLYWIG